MVNESTATAAVFHDCLSYKKSSKMASKILSELDDAFLTKS